MPRGRIIPFPTIVPKRDDHEDDDMCLTVPCGSGYATYRHYVEASEPGYFATIHYKGVDPGPFDPCNIQCASWYQIKPGHQGLTGSQRLFPDPFPGGNTGYPECPE